MSNQSIILIGALAAGKTTVGKLLAEALGMAWIEVDDLRWAYYAEIGYDHDYAQALMREQGFAARAAYWKPFELHAVERVLADYPTDHVISFGAGNSVFDAPLLERAQRALAGFPNVILLLPSPDVDESVRVMQERLRPLTPDIPDEIRETLATLNRAFIEHPSNAALATMTVYTLGKTPAETCAEIVQRLKSPGSI